MDDIQYEKQLKVWKQYIDARLVKEMEEASKYRWSCYLAGPIGRVTLEEAQNWREWLKPRLAKLDIGHIDPLYKYGKYMQEMKNLRDRLNREGNINRLREWVQQLVFWQDIECVKFVDFLIGYVSTLDVKWIDPVEPSPIRDTYVYGEICGTYGEFTFAKYLGKPVFIVTDRKLKPNKVPNWAIGCSSNVFGSFEDLLEMLKGSKYWVRKR